jgi:hypothetical protein
MAELAKALGLSNTVTIEGKEYKMCAPDLEILGEFEIWIENRALSKVERTRGMVEESIYQERHREVMQMISSEMFSVGKPAFAEASTSHDGLCHILYLCLKRENPSISKDMVKRAYESEINQSLMTRLGEQMRVPNEEAARE